MRQTASTDLGGYPFSPEDMAWPVPPGYVESNDAHERGNRGSNERSFYRESGVGYSVSGSVYGSPEGGRW
jgi:hypothetical protein